MTDASLDDSFLIAYQNVRGTRTKLRTLTTNAAVNDSYKIIIFSETWLKEEIHSAETGLHKYEIFRSDRRIPGVDLGGGVLIAVHKSIPN